VRSASWPATSTSAPTCNRTCARPTSATPAFAHKGGVHVSAVAKNPQTYEHIPPEWVGNSRQVLLSDLSGRANVLAKSAGGAPEEVAAVVERLKELEHRGYAFEGAEASFQLMSQKVRGHYRPYFVLHGYKVHIDKRDQDHVPTSEASIQLEVGGQREHTAATGDGPVNALDRALGKALGRFYPTLAALKLTDYKVRVLSGGETGNLERRPGTGRDDRRNRHLGYGRCEQRYHRRLVQRPDRRHRVQAAQG
jgi:2-isopropylmalate synthase